MVWGAVVGAVACVIVGFSWGGWVTGGTARKDAATAAHDAVVVALAPICAAQYRAQSDGPAKIAELAKASSWERGSVVEKSGYAHSSRAPRSAESSLPTRSWRRLLISCHPIPSIR